MKRKPLKYIEQKRLVHFHTHQKRFGDMLSRRHFVSLPDPAPQTDSSAGAGPSGADAPADTPTTASHKLSVSEPAVQNRMRHPTDVRSGVAPTVPVPPQIDNPSRPKLLPPPVRPPQPVWSQPQPPKRLVDDKLKMIKDQEIARRAYNTIPQPVYSRHPMGQMTMHPQPQMSSYNPNLSAMQQRQQQIRMRLLQMPPEQRQMYMQKLHAQQQARQMQHIMSSQFPPQYSQMGHPHMGQPMQATPPMPMQTIQHGYAPQQMMVRQQYPQHPAPTMNLQQRPMY